MAFIEGAMGLYDGVDVDGGASTASLARSLRAPVILVVNTARMTRSVAAMVSGYQHFEPDVRIAAVILNNVAGSRHEHKLRAAVERYCGIPVVGSVPRGHGFAIAEQHLGLVPFATAEDGSSVIDQVRCSIEGYLDLDGILSIARSADPFSPDEIGADPLADEPKAPCVRLGVMRDRVFSFYYQENLEALRQAGAQLVFIDSLRDEELPRIDGLYIGGGFPELFLEELEANSRLRQDIAHSIEKGLPVYAECAGLMYLCQRIHWRGSHCEMVGAIPCEVYMSQRPQGHGYAVAEVVNENPIFPAGLMLRGHEFHYSRLSKADSLTFAYRLHRGQGIYGKFDAIIYKNVFAAYTHLHALGVPQWAEGFVSLASGRSMPQRSFSIAESKG